MFLKPHVLYFCIQESKRQRQMHKYMNYLSIRIHIAWQLLLHSPNQACINDETVLNNENENKVSKASKLIYLVSPYVLMSLITCHVSVHFFFSKKGAKSTMHKIILHIYLTSYNLVFLVSIIYIITYSDVLMSNLYNIIDIFLSLSNYLEGKLNGIPSLIFHLFI